MGTSKVILGATLVMVVSLAIVLGLVLVLLAELYCTLLLRRKQLKKSAANSSATAVTSAGNNESSLESQLQQQDHHSGAQSLSSFYQQGVLRAPRNFLFPSILHHENADLEKQKETHFLVPEFHDDSSPDSQTTAISQRIRLVFSSPPSPSFSPAPSPKIVHEFPLHCSTSSYNDIFSGGGNEENLVYISNPIFDNESNFRPSNYKVDTPFETPNSSPSHLETIASSGEDDRDDEDEKGRSESHGSSSGLIVTPPLTPMKKLPAEACSVSLRDATSLGTSGSDDSNTHNDGASSSSSSGTPCTSPSW